MTDFNDSTAGASSAGARPTGSAADQGGDEISYPENHVVGVVDAAHVREALDALEAGGFLESEIQVMHGPTDAGRLDATTGRSGLLDRVLRVAERLGVRNDELKLKERYEDALRAGHYVVLALAPTEERRDRAAAVLRAHDAQTVNYFGRFTIERL